MSSSIHACDGSAIRMAWSFAPIERALTSMPSTAQRGSTVSKLPSSADNSLPAYATPIATTMVAGYPLRRDPCWRELTARAILRKLAGRRLP